MSKRPNALQERRGHSLVSSALYGLRERSSELLVRKASSSISMPRALARLHPVSISSDPSLRERRCQRFRGWRPRTTDTPVGRYTENIFFRAKECKLIIFAQLCRRTGPKRALNGRVMSGRDWPGADVSGSSRRHSERRRQLYHSTDLVVPALWRRPIAMQIALRFHFIAGVGEC